MGDEMTNERAPRPTLHAATAVPDPEPQAAINRAFGIVA
jgi:hypothetical protein